MLLRIEAPHFVAGVVVRDHRVAKSAPIVKYMRGWPQSKVLSYCASKGWRVST